MSSDPLAPYADQTNPERAAAVLDGAEQAAEEEKELRVGLSVVILNLDHPELIVPLVEQLRRQAAAFRDRGLAFEIAIGDTGSTEREVLEAYERWRGEVEVVPELRYHFSRCNNEVTRRATKCDAVLFLNNDVILPERDDVLLSLYRSLEGSPDIGVLGAVLYFPEGTLQHLGIDFFREPPLRGFCFHPHTRERAPDAGLPPSFEAPAATGSFLLMRRRLFDRIGGFDDAYGIECQDVDLCLRVHRLGYRTRVHDLGRTVHLENATRPKGEESWPDRRLFVRRWRAYVEAHFL